MKSAMKWGSVYRSSLWWRRTPSRVVYSVRHSSYLSAGTEDSVGLLPAKKEGAWSTGAFSRLGVQDCVAKKLWHLGITEPTHIQAQAIPIILQGCDTVLAAETGCGKTLAYILPLLEQIEQFKKVQRSASSVPLALILVPSQELATQVYQTIKGLQTDPNRDLAAILAKTTRLKELQSHPVVITTPNMLLQHVNIRTLSGLDQLSTVRWVVLDEADSLLSGGTEVSTKLILSRVRKKGAAAAHRSPRIQEDHGPQNGVQCVFAAATIPNYGKYSVDSYLTRKFGEAERVTTDNVHRVNPLVNVSCLRLFDSHVEYEDGTILCDSGDGPKEVSSGVEMKFVLHGDIDKPARSSLRLSALLKLLERGGQENEGVLGTMIFVNSIKSAETTETFLRDRKFACRAFHKRLGLEERSEILTAYARGELDILVCTDLAARGIDTETLEFATDVVSYLHRIGRTGRAGRGGTVSHIIAEENNLLWEMIRQRADRPLNQSFSRGRSLRKKFKRYVKGRQDWKCRYDFEKLN